MLASLVTGCTSAPDSPEQSQLDSALHTWDAQGPVSYSFTWQRWCECSEETTQPIRISVVNNVITQAVYVATQQPVSADVRSQLLTIDGVFAEIQDAIANNADSVTVEYDSESGRPLSVGVDYDRGIADEELALQLTDFQSGV
jgi:hypothetical protein